MELILLKFYSSKENHECQICKAKFNNNKAGHLTKHLENDHNITLPSYLKCYFYLETDLICQYEGCNNQVELQQKSKIPKKYCNDKKCLNKRKPKVTYPSKICPVCGDTFTRMPVIKTCSKECRSKLMSNKIKQWHANMPKEEKERHFKNIITKTAATRRKNNTPSWNSGKTGVYSEETIEKIRNATLKQFENQTFKKTSIEIIIEKLLNDLEIEYTYSFILKKRQYDFLLKESNVIIECDGDYWHGNPKFYPNPNERQIEKRKQDVIKDEIAKENGFTIIRFWEDDIHNDLENIKQAIVSHVTSKLQHS